MSRQTKSVFPISVALAATLVLAASAADGPVSRDKEPTRTAIYDRDQNHLWNRVHSALLIRVGPDDKAYGEDRLEPLLWAESKNLLQGESAERAATVLEEFVRDKGESLIDDPLKRAILQRDLWLVFNQATDGDHDQAGSRVKSLLAKVIRRLGLSANQIAKLPDNYASAVASKRFADQFDPENPERSYLPPDLFKPDGPWVCLGRTSGPTAPQHLSDRGSNRFTNSVFLILLKFPAGREATLEFLKRLAAFDKPLYVPNADEKSKGALPNLPNPGLPQWPKGTEVALVRRAMLVDANGGIVASPLTESVQLRVMRTEMPAMTAKTFNELTRREADTQAFLEFQLRRTPLFAGESGGLRDVSKDRDFKTGFNSYVWDEFQKERTQSDTPEPFPERSQPFKNNRASCFGCHQIPGVYGFNSFHGDFPFAAGRNLATGPAGGNVPNSHSLAPMTVEAVERAAVKWKQHRPGWIALGNPRSD